MMTDPQAKLCQALIEEYLHGKALTWQNLRELPEAQAKQIMSEASLYAALKLAEVENRAHLLHNIHGSARLEA